MSRKKGEKNIEVLRSYLDKVSALPAREGKVSVVGVAAAAGIDRQVLYRNEKAKALLAAAADEKGLVAIEDRQVENLSKSANERALEKQVRSLEARNAALVAEISDLRSRILRLKHMEDMMIEGRRVIP